MKSYAFLFWAYAVTWLGIAAYLLMLLFRVRAAERRIEGIERHLGDDREG